MSENLKTIRELADELGVSKQAVWQKIKRDTSIDLRQFTSTKGNTVYVNVDGQKAIKSMLSNDSAQKSINWTIFIQLIRRHLKYDCNYKN